MASPATSQIGNSNTLQLTNLKEAEEEEEGEEEEGEEEEEEEEEGEEGEEEEGEEGRREGSCAIIAQSIGSGVSANVTAAAASLQGPSLPPLAPLTEGKPLVATGQFHKAINIIPALAHAYQALQ